MKKFVCSRILREWIIELTEMQRALIRALIGFEYKKASETDSQFKVLENAEKTVVIKS